MTQADTINAVTTYLNSNLTQLVDVHVGTMICFIVKNADINILEDISSPSLPVSIRHILSSVKGQYHYIFVDKV